MNSIKCDLWVSENIIENNKKEEIKSPKVYKSKNIISYNQSSCGSKHSKKKSVASSNDSKCAVESNSSEEKPYSKKHQAKTPPPEKAVKLIDLKIQDLMVKEVEIQDTKDTSSKKISSEILTGHSDLEFKSSTSILEDYKHESKKIEQDEKTHVHCTVQKNEPKEIISLISKPPSGKHSIDKKNKEKKVKEETKASENLLINSNEDIFSLLENPDCESEFATSISSVSSQMDYDNMAIEAMAEINSLETKANDKNIKAKCSKNNKWEELYNKEILASNKDRIHVIEEDIENEIDSEYSMTLKKNKSVHDK